MAVGAGKIMMHLFKVELAIMMLQGICLKVEFVEFVIQILNKVDHVGERIVPYSV